MSPREELQKVAEKLNDELLSRVITVRNHC